MLLIERKVIYESRKRNRTNIFKYRESWCLKKTGRSNIYINSGEYSSKPAQVATLQRLAGVVDRNSYKVSRGVFRGVVSPEVFQEIGRNGLHDRLEVAVPLSEGQEVLIYWAHNAKDRAQLVPTETMIDQTSVYPETKITPEDRIYSLKQRGYEFTQNLSDNYVDQVEDLWGLTFGWNTDEILALQARLAKETKKDPKDRTVWFSAICENGIVVSLATAERLAIPSAKGQIDLVESTEWRTRDEYAGQGLMTATLLMLNAQILSDLNSKDQEYPIVYAECNFQSRSDRAGYGAGFRIPDRTYAPQIIKQNVQVGDGYDLSTNLRDFTFMYLTPESIDTYYSPVQREAILSEGLR